MFTKCRECKYCRVYENLEKDYQEQHYCILKREWIIGNIFNADQKCDVDCAENEAELKEQKFQEELRENQDGKA